MIRSLLLTLSCVLLTASSNNLLEDKRICFLNWPSDFPTSNLQSSMGGEMSSMHYVVIFCKSERGVQSQYMYKRVNIL
jgi:hypothetical protein